MRVALLQLSKDLADVVDQSLHLVYSAFFLAFHRQDDADHSFGGRDVEQLGLPLTRRCEEWLCR